MTPNGAPCCALGKAGSHEGPCIGSPAWRAEHEGEPEPYLLDGAVPVALEEDCARPGGRVCRRHGGEMSTEEDCGWRMEQGAAPEQLGAGEAEG